MVNVFLSTIINQGIVTNGLWSIVLFFFFVYILLKYWDVKGENVFHAIIGSIPSCGHSFMYQIVKVIDEK